MLTVKHPMRRLHFMVLRRLRVQTPYSLTMTCLLKLAVEKPVCSSHTARSHVAERALRLLRRNDTEWEKLAPRI